MSKEKVIVTGGAGFIGSHLVDKLIDLNYDVHVVDDLSSGKKANINKQATFHKQDISAWGARFILDTIFVDAKYIFHLAAKARVQASIEDPLTFHETNVTGTLNVLWAAKQVGAKKVVLSSTSSVYGNSQNLPLKEDHKTDPISPYAAQKVMCEVYAKMFNEVYNVPTVCLRYFNVYGTRMDANGAYPLVISVFTGQKQSKKALTITGDGEQRRDFTFVGDVVEANILAATNESCFNGEIFNIGNGDNRSVNQIAEAFGGTKRYIPQRLEPKETLADITKAATILNWYPTTDVIKWIGEFKKTI